MGVTGVTRDERARTMRLTAEWDAPPERAWRLWADPRRLERWWGPPDHPATVTEHDLRPGGRVAYVVTGAGGETFPSDAAMEQLVRMGFAEGLSAAVGQADGLLAAWDAS